MPLRPGIPSKRTRNLTAAFSTCGGGPTATATSSIPAADCGGACPVNAELAAAHARLQAFLEGDDARRASTPRLSLAEHLVKWLEDRAAEHVGLSPKSIRAYQLTAKRLSEARIGKLRSDEIEAQDVRGFLRRLRAQQVPPSALARELLHLRMIFRWLRRRE